MHLKNSADFSVMLWNLKNVFKAKTKIAIEVENVKVNDKN
jgi:hypothetical protein